MEVVSELLGHSKITVTQEHYAKVVKSKISEEVMKLCRMVVCVIIVYLAP